MDTRYIKVSSREAVVGKDTSNFVVDLSSAIAEIHDRIVGLSIESLSFPNVQPNVSPLTGIGQRLTVNGETLIIPESYYNATELAAAIQTAVDSNATLNALDITVVWEPLPIARFTIADGGDPSTVTVSDPDLATPSLFTNMGYASGVVTGKTTGLPDLTGLKMVALTSSTISSHGNGSIDGHGRITTVIHSVPVHAEYGQTQGYKADSVKPMIYFGHLARNSDMGTIDIGLVSSSGEPVQIGAGEIQLVLKVWVGAGA